MAPLETIKFHHFLAENHNRFENSETNNHNLGGTIHFLETNEDGQRVISRFFMNYDLSQELVDYVGVEEWEQSLR